MATCDRRSPEGVEDKSRLNSEKIWKIQKKSKLNSEKIGKIWKKGKLNSEDMKNMEEK
jgi:hypothetical protein